LFRLRPRRRVAANLPVAMRRAHDSLRRRGKAREGEEKRTGKRKATETDPSHKSFPSAANRTRAPQQTLGMIRVQRPGSMSRLRHTQACGCAPSAALRTACPAPLVVAGQGELWFMGPGPNGPHPPGSSVFGHARQHAAARFVSARAAKCYFRGVQSGRRVAHRSGACGLRERPKQ
jgi:hypothetical protein